MNEEGGAKMTGLELLKEEMVKRGANKSMLESKTLPLVLDIISNSNGEYIQLYELQQQINKLTHEIDRLRIDRTRFIMQIETNETEERERIREWNAELDERTQKLNELHDSLMECETAEARDAVRKARLFIESIKVGTVFDNTAFIYGLGAILGGAEVIEQGQKINPNLFNPEKRPKSDIDQKELFNPSRKVVRV